MHRVLRLLPLGSFAVATVTLLYLGTVLYSHSGDELSWTRRDAFARSVQAGERVIPARNMGGVLRQELAAERLRNQRDQRLAMLVFGAALLIALGVAVGRVLNTPRGGDLPRQAAA
jgi:hypothetical protein